MIKRLASIILLLAAFALSSAAEQSKGNNNSIPVGLEIKSTNSEGKKILRSTLFIPIEAWYEIGTRSLVINYTGKSTGIVNLYLNGTLYETSPAINTSFYISEPGMYSVQILTDSWYAIGSIEI